MPGSMVRVPPFVPSQILRRRSKSSGRRDRISLRGLLVARRSRKAELLRDCPGQLFLVAYAVENHAAFRLEDAVSDDQGVCLLDQCGNHVQVFGQVRLRECPADDRIVLDTQDFADKETRWPVNDIRPNSFVWREEESSDGGKTWELLAQHQMKRRGAAPP